MTLDAVIIATPDFAHTLILLDATRLRKDAFVEKPMATVLDHANEAVRLVGENKTIVQVGNQRRSDPRHRAGATLIQSGIAPQSRNRPAAHGPGKGQRGGGGVPECIFYGTRGTFDTQSWTARGEGGGLAATQNDPRVQCLTGWSVCAAARRPTRPSRLGMRTR
jgi:hypothetical protein